MVVLRALPGLVRDLGVGDEGACARAVEAVDFGDAILNARLATGDATVGELAEPYAMSLQAVSKHVAVLESAGLVTKTRTGRERTVHLEADVLDLMTAWIDRYRRRAEARYRRLDHVLDEMNDRRGIGNDKEETA
ncbi:MAG: helix-turn-helix domain-containing protein [Acidimicrobiia bacterium]|nr:helix-turn-helix domain-containing protein [Acidimicrobiia bacterium]MDH5314642.1 helix-turn-helix domain-containing protein [Actinomycetota bacterium]